MIALHANSQITLYGRSQTFHFEITEIVLITAQYLSFSPVVICVTHSGRNVSIKYSNKIGGLPLCRILVHPPKNLSKNQNCSKKSTQESQIYARIQKVRKNHGKNQESTQESQFHAEFTQESWFFTKIYATDEVKL